MLEDSKLNQVAARRLRTAGALCRKALDINDKDPITLYKSALVLVQSGNFQAGYNYITFGIHLTFFFFFAFRETYFLLALEQNPNFYDGLLEYASFLSRAGLHDQARKFRARADELRTRNNNLIGIDQDDKISFAIQLQQSN